MMSIMLNGLHVQIKKREESIPSADQRKSRMVSAATIEQTKQDAVSATRCVARTMTAGKAEDAECVSREF